MPILVVYRPGAGLPGDTYPSLPAAMEAVLAHYPEAVFSDVDFDADDTIWVWPTNAASQHARTTEAVCWLREED